MNNYGISLTVVCFVHIGKYVSFVFALQSLMMWTLKIISAKHTRQIDILFVQQKKNHMV